MMQYFEDDAKNGYGTILQGRLFQSFLSIEMALHL